ncbi:band 7 protein AGAP004871 isoform X1 [Drosophila teissieri]|uniref:band 7 protein AGAP004871 isoform X1 n=2 Tax=Drosophila teissieri TaxID=7243 RepID=UPI001CBA2E8B|nr:band 7 protein AGAP004871 isoform X1 [Drosophila teissieri]
MRERYAVEFEKQDNVEPNTEDDNNNYIFEKIAVVVSWIFVVVFLPFSLCFCLSIAFEFQRLVIFRLGRIRSCLGPGLVFQLPCIDSFNTVDIRTDVVNVHPQEMLTNDSVTITVNAVVFYCIYHPINSIIKVDDAKDATKRISQVTLRNIVGSKRLHELLASRQQLSREIQLAVAKITEQWGVRVERVDMMEIALPSSLARSLATEAEATREARAKIILAEGEAKASKALKECSDVMSDNQITLQLRHLQILCSLAKEHRINVLFPIPLEIMEPFMDGKDSSETAQDDDDRRDSDDEYDYLHLFSPKVYINDSPPDFLNDAQTDGTPKTKENADETKPPRSWLWPPFFRPSRAGNDGEQPSSSRRVRPESGQPSPRSNRTDDGIEPYPLLTKPPPRPSSPATKPSSIPIPPRPDPPSLPPVPSHPKLPPIPPHPTLPPIPERPVPPPKATSPPPPDKDPKVPKADKNYYF